MWFSQLHQQPETFHINNLQLLDAKTQHRLKDLGLIYGKTVTIIRRYPFNGPVVIAFDHQQVGLRSELVRCLQGEQVTL
ncbi:FeoA family protein [Loigolactobacillus zhaoyuanensis]|uniref:Ferrous iron transport protein A n=1 Tax=Loigolactobacillus zhaoyuanensis TaxID=2486017 RepID=A0ABW8UE14_9LACO|nr:FeoA family protein [Loigolactobacillus zhaoyuanensis]